MIVVACAVLVALAAIGVACTLITVANDGYRGIPPR
jgi:hypothetical protein